MEQGNESDKVKLLLAADMDGDGFLSRSELSGLISSSYLTALGLRGKHFDLPLLEAVKCLTNGEDGDEKLMIPDGVMDSLALLSQPEKEWQDGHPVAVLDLHEDTTLKDFSDIVGNVATNYTFAVAGVNGDDKLSREELAEWCASDHESFQIVSQILA